jgi:intein/homing endonuclease
MCKLFNIFKKEKEDSMALKSKEYYDNKWPKAPIIYGGRALRGKKDRVGVDVKNFIVKNDEILSSIVLQYGLKKRTYDETAHAVQKWVVKFLTYKYDDESSKCPEFWQFPFETIHSEIGDCVATYEEIYVKNGVKKVGDLKVGDEVLSYDFNKKEYCYKPITKIWEKGKLPLKKVHTRNGQSVHTTDDHPFWSRTNQVKKGVDAKYEKIKLSDIDLSTPHKRKIPFVKELPYEIQDIDWLTEDLCFVVGHYLAEGSKEGNGSKVTTSGYDIYEEILPKLDEANIPYSESKNGNGVPYIRFLKSDFKDFLKKFKTNSFNIHIPEEIFHLPKNKLQALLDGLILGDGYYDERKVNKRFNSTTNRRFGVYTSCERFVRDLQRIGLQLGTSFGIYEGGNRGGWGKNKTYTIYMNENSHFYKDYGYPGMSEIAISEIEDMGKKVEMRDFEVADTHTFIFKNGTIGHNCEDGAILITSLCIAAGIPEWRVKVAAGYVQSSPTAPQGGHAYNIYLAEDGNWRILDWCIVDNRRTLIQTPNGSKRISQLKEGDYVIGYDEEKNEPALTKIEKLGNRHAKNIFKIEFENGDSIYSTGEHPFYVDGKWITTDELEVGMEPYWVKPQKLFHQFHDHKKDPWRQDAAWKTAEKNKESGLYKELSERQKKNNIFTRKDVRKKLSENNAMKRPEVMMKAYQTRENGKISGPESRFAEYCQEHNLPVEFTGDGKYWIKTSDGPKNPDFHIPGTKKVIEVSDKSFEYFRCWEDYKKERAKLFEEKGYKVEFVLFDRNNFDSSFDQKQLHSFVLNGNKITNITDVRTRNGKYKNGTTVWNMHCTPHNNYFVNGNLVHNCYYEDSNTPIDRKPLAKDGGQRKAYKDVWFTFNSEYSWNQQNLTVGGRMANDTGDKSSNTLNEVLEKKLDLTQIMESVEKKVGDFE